MVPPGTVTDTCFVQGRVFVELTTRVFCQDAVMATTWLSASAGEFASGILDGARALRRSRQVRQEDIAGQRGRITERHGRGGLGPQQGEAKERHQGEKGGPEGAFPAPGGRRGVCG